MARYSYHRLDANHTAIRDALKAVGASVDTRCPGDLLVGFRGTTYLLEVKTKTGNLRKSHEKFRASWRGQYAVVRPQDEALKVIGADQEPW